MVSVAVGQTISGVVLIGLEERGDGRGTKLGATAIAGIPEHISEATILTWLCPPLSVTNNRKRGWGEISISGFFCIAGA